MRSDDMTSKSKSKAGKPSLKKIRKEIVGTWKLISAEDRSSPTGPWVPYTFGNPPSGYFIYDDTGHASVQIMTTPPQSIAVPDTPTPAEALLIFQNYIAYYGTYTIDEKNLTVQVEGAWDPSQVGTAQARPYQLKGDTLIIGDQVTYIRTLKRFK
jgi:hypothetical protein